MLAQRFSCADGADRNVALGGSEDIGDLRMCETFEQERYHLALSRGKRSYRFEKAAPELFRSSCGFRIRCVVR